MAIPFRDVTGQEDLGFAGYLRYTNESDGKGVRGALFCINARGEPIEFGFSRIDLPSSFLWRPGDARRHVVLSLSRSLLGACSKEPRLLLGLAEEVPPRVFTEDLELKIPFCRIATSNTVIQAPTEAPERLGEAAHLFWATETPALESPARTLLDALQSRDLLLEPFDRAAVGLEEAFREA